MKSIEYRTVDKTLWPRGEWNSEPDKRQWLDPKTGLPCMIVRNHSGAWCGYVGVPQGHAQFGKDYDQVDVDVHGGLTFASRCQPLTTEAWQKWRKTTLAGKDEAERYPNGDSAKRLKEWGDVLDSYEGWKAKGQATYICHLPEPGESDEIWWLGFDCAHLGDLMPAFEGRFSLKGSYRNQGYVQREVERLAKQLKE